MASFQFKDLRIAHKLMICFAAIVLAALTAGALIHYQHTVLRDADRWMEHSYRVLRDINAAVSATIDQETGLRGFVITGNRANLAPYEDGRKAYARHIAAARELTADNPAHQRRIADIESAMERWTREVAEPALAFAASPDTREQARELERTGIAKRHFDAVRAKLGEIEDAEEALLADRRRIKQSARDGTTSAIALGALIIVAVAVLSVFLLVRGLGTPLTQMTQAMSALAAGNLAVAVPAANRHDEIGNLASAFERFKNGLVEAERLRGAQEELRQQAAGQRSADMHRVAEAFETAVGRIVDTVSSSSCELEAAADTLTRTAEQTRQLSALVASASDESSKNVQSVAGATEQMIGSVGEINRRTQDSAQIASEAVEQAEKADLRIDELSQAARRIGDVVALITAIAEQTNLLALNATIEAARAGEAGRGFAVVAAEVKSLAGQTARATGEIGSQIGAMQSATAEVVTAIKTIGSTIKRTFDITALISAAAEEQSSATREIARNVQEAAGGTAQVASNIADVSRGATETRSASGQVLASARALAAEGAKLKVEMVKFLETVRAA